MAESPITLEAARAAKDETKRRLADCADVVGVGVTRSSRGYAVKVNLCGAVDRARLPRMVKGVPLVFEVVGKIRKR
jgi:hypothetical protein